jgi:hypothetical protein
MDRNLMQLPIIEPAPLVENHAEVFRDLFENRRQFQHFENYLTGLIVCLLPTSRVNKGLD